MKNNSPVRPRWYSRFFDFNFDSPRPRQRASQRKDPGQRCRPRLLALEDRVVPSLTSVFEIETNANALDQSSPVTARPDDWNSALQKASPNPITNNAAPAGSSHAEVASFVADKASIDTSFFIQGGSKDINDITQWRFS